ncbi:MAG TPA: trehalose-phosphatase [Noviherbaspirillum sp.]|jgi:trehalose 6-phosphate phosphatase|uniref:trehalose-phosphatase n=1 Tax=Noviherbaspirillum sp. TaxID=1926288 RepID=UPI002DDD17DF|nr:trehalose-phosphatase [Noviherbaspirillum sp.]HEV2610834.1 trehalose-phosphatase [Noviherbaspirillum sp.]
MIPLFSEQGLERLDRIVSPGLLCAFDFDGTLAPIVRDPAQARLSSDMVRRLDELAALAPVAIITGRSLEDIQSRLSFSPDYLIGNHGIEGMPGWEQSAQAYKDMCGTWQQQVSDALAAADGFGSGVMLENKRYSLSVHYRNAADPATTSARLQQVFTQLQPSPRIVDGKFVFNLLPPDAADKGSALQQLISRTGASGVIYAGDDVTDEDVFRVRRPDLLSVRVEQNPDSAAEFFLPRFDDMTQLLDELITRLRAFGATNPKRWKPAANH